MLILLKKSATSLRSDEVSKVFALDPFPRSPSLCSDDVSKVFCSDEVSKVFCSNEVSKVFCSDDVSKDFALDPFASSVSSRSLSIKDEEDDVSRLSKVSSQKRVSFSSSSLSSALQAILRLLFLLIPLCKAFSLDEALSLSIFDLKRIFW